MEPMTKAKVKSKAEIGKLLATGEQFTANSELERKYALTGAPYLGVKVTTRKSADGFVVIPLVMAGK